MRFIPARSSACAPSRCISHTPPSLSGGKRSPQNCLLRQTNPPAGMRIQLHLCHFLSFFFTVNTLWRSALTFGVFSALTRFGLAGNRNAEHANIIMCHTMRRQSCLLGGCLFQLSYHAWTEVCPFSSPSSLDQ